MNYLKFWAHSDPTGLSPEAPGSKWQPLAEHLQSVAKLARSLAQHGAPGYTHFHDLAEWCGLLHDYGKFTNCFQNMIVGTGKGPCPHSIHGAAMAYEKLKAVHIALVIAGHHSGLPDLPGEFRKRILSSEVDAGDLLNRAKSELPAIGKLLESEPPKLEHPGTRFDLLTRMLSSCLVDADRLDTAGRTIIQSPLRAEERLDILLRHLQKLSDKSPDSAVKTARRQVLQDCLSAAAHSNDIFSLSVPTGGGKTLSAMAFALKRAALQPQRFRRVIIVIPFLSIIEQNAEVYAHVFGSDSILEHHSGSFAQLREQNEHFLPLPDEDNQYRHIWKRPETENWDAPLIVTTNVRFFESLFSNHPSDLRRVHNIARSIIILDEVQVLPRRLLAPLLEMMDELCRDWGCSFVLSTATKPAFEKQDASDLKDRRWAPGRVREIMSAPAELHRRLRRASIDWRITSTADWPEIADWMRRESRALCVVNLRDHASKLFDEVKLLAPDDCLFHLSTRMCASHRLKVIHEIRRRLSERLPCLVVSTQLIEAGVDLDFPVAFRALGPLDSIVQVAGRADREGFLTAKLGMPAGRVVVFRPLDDRTPPNEYREATEKTGNLARTRDIQPDDLTSMEKFFEDYYSIADLGIELLDLRGQFRFKTLSAEFEMISSRMQDVFVPYGEGKPLVNELTHARQLTASLRRELQRYTVGLQPWEFNNAKDRIIFPLAGADNIWIASGAAYDEVKGLLTEASADGFVV